MKNESSFACAEWRVPIVIATAALGWCFALWAPCYGQGANAGGQRRSLLDVAQLDETTDLNLEKGEAELVKESGQTQAIALRWEKADQRPRLLVRPEETWNLAAYWFVTAEVENEGEQTVRVALRAASREPQWRTITREYVLAAGQRATVRLPLVRRLPEALEEKLYGMRGYPIAYEPNRGINAEEVRQVVFEVTGLADTGRLRLLGIWCEGIYEEPTWAAGDTEQLFPMIDRFGQYRHADWPGKTHSTDEFPQRMEAELADLGQHPAPEAWDRFGGWAEGPKLKATGHFRTEKVDGKWWLVDPDGHLFWSHGIDCVRSTTATTPITDRRHYFEELPGEDSALGAFFGRGSWAPHGYYQGKGTYETYSFSGANLYRKYGPDWKSEFDAFIHRRLPSWGLNTIGNWSDPEVYLLAKTPYVVTIGSRARPIEGSSGYWGKFPDPFDPDFPERLQQAVESQKDRTAEDPWCVGYFVDNELSWGDELSLAVAALESPADQPAKIAFVEELKAKYDSIDALNDAWETDHASWDALLAATDAPGKDKARDDLGRFYSQIAEAYFRQVAEAVHTHAPGKLYLGCRFAWVNDRAARAAAKYCDIVSYNRYTVDVAELALPDGLDRPLIIGEFHFGALDRGMFHTGLRMAADQQDRADAYRAYVRSALDNPYVVGTHWFQLMDQATTGRGDGENYQIGFLDVCDNPYPEIIAAAREIGHEMYQRRAGR